MVSLATVSTEAANQRVPTEPPSPPYCYAGRGLFLFHEHLGLRYAHGFPAFAGVVQTGAASSAGAAREPLKRARLRAEAPLIGTHSLVDAHL